MYIASTFVFFVVILCKLNLGVKAGNEAFMICGLYDVTIWPVFLYFRYTVTEQRSTMNN